MSRRAPGTFGPVLALTVAVAVAGFGVLAPLAHWAIEPTPLPPPFAPQNQDAETILFVLTFAVLLPSSLLVVPRIADRIVAAAGAGGLRLVAGAAVASLLGALAFVKLSERLPWGGGIGVLFAASLAWLAAAGGLSAFAASPRGRRLADRGEAWERAPWVLAGGLAVLLALSFAKLDSIAVVPLALGLVAAAAAVAVRGRVSAPPPRGWGVALDVAVVVLLLLAVPNLLVFSPDDPAAAADTTIIQFHQNFFLGPANQVLGGGAMLIDTLSQYGVGSIYFLDAWFQLAPIGNGTLGLLEGLLLALTFVVAFAIIRLAGVGRLLAAAAMTIAVVVLVYNLIYPVGALLQHGTIRFGLPIGLIAAAVLEARRPERAAIARSIQLAIVAVGSIWALEAFAYTLITLGGLIAFELATTTAGRRRLLVVWAAGVLAACAVAHLAFAGLTLAFAGELPDWGLYLRTLRDFLVGGIGEFTYDFSTWSTGFAVAGLYLASVAAIVLAVRRERGMVDEQRAAFFALSGSTAYGIALFSYFVNRSADHIVPYISLPAVMVTAIWLSLLLRPSASTAAGPWMQRIALAGASVIAALLVAVAWSSAGERFSQSALAYAAPGGESFSAGLDRLWDPPELAEGAEEGARLLERHMPAEEESLVLTSADLGIEILMETGRINTIPLSDPWEDSIVPDAHIDAVNDAVEALEPGDRALTDPDARAVLAGGGESATGQHAGIAPLQLVAMEGIAERFRLDPVASGEDGMMVAELVPRGGP